MRKQKDRSGYSSAQCELSTGFRKGVFTNMTLAHAVTLTCAVLSVTSLSAVGQECGDNPMERMLLVAKKSGKELHRVLGTLKDIDSPAYSNLVQQFQHYASCVGLVDTGYFRKRSQEVLPPPETASFSGPAVKPASWNEEKNAVALDSALHDLKNLDLLLKKIQLVKEEIQRVKSGLLQVQNACNYLNCPTQKSQKRNDNNPGNVYAHLLAKYFKSLKSGDNNI